MDTSHPDADLIDGFLEGKRQAVSDIGTYINVACRRWQARLGTDMDEIKADASYKLYISLSRSEFSYRSRLSTYVTTIVNRTCIDYLRLGDRFSATDVNELPLIARQLTQEEALDRRQLGRLMFRVLRRMRRSCLDLWHMLLKRNMKCAAIGEELGKTEANIRRQLWACREEAKAIREELLRKDKRLGSSSA